MKGKHLLLSFIAAIAFAGCSEDEDPAPNGGENDLKDCGYIAVNIVQPSSIGGRAEETGSDAGTGTTENTEFISGLDKENGVSGASFFVFKKDTNNQLTYHTGKYVETLTAETGEDTNPQIEKIYQAILVLNLQGNEQSFGGEIFCVLNPTSKIKEWSETQAASSSLTKDVLLKEIANYGEHADNKFIMTNSAYNDGSKDVCGAEFSKSDLHTDENEAKNQPVNIYVERVVAKVTADATNFNNTAKLTPYTTATTTTPEYIIRITGIELANVARTAGLFKCINTTDGFNTPTWPNPALAAGTSWSFHDPANKRCYWEFTPLSQTYENQSYNEIAGTASDKVYGEVSKNNLKLSDKFTYIQPNTSAMAAIEPGTSTTATSILVTAQLGSNVSTTTNGTTTTTFKPADLVWLMGSYFSNDDAKNLLCEYLAKESYLIKTTATDGTSPQYASITKDNLVWKQKQDQLTNNIEESVAVSGLKDYQAIAQIQLTNGLIIKATKNENGTYTEIKKEDNTSYSKYDVNAYLTDPKFRAEVFVDGMCYYFMPIDQAPVMGNAKGTNSFNGVVRNHVYQLNLTGISGIGTAVFDPTKDIIPEKPEHDQFRYLAAKINVLKWKVVSQEIDFQGN